MDDLINRHFKTPCGLITKYVTVMDDETWYHGVEWSAENGNPLILCPFYQKNERCSQNSPIWEDYWEHTGKRDMHLCSLSVTDEPYVYDNSVEKVMKDAERYKSNKYAELKDKRNGHLCSHQVQYNYRLAEWQDAVNPLHCIIHNCNYCSLRCEDNEKGREYILYDLATVIRVKGFGFIPDRESKTILRNLKANKFPVRSKIASMILKMNGLSDLIREKTERYLYGSNYEGNLISYEILNVRAEKRATGRNPDDEELSKKGWRIIYDDTRVQAKKATANKQKRLDGTGIKEEYEQLTLFDFLPK